MCVCMYECVVYVCVHAGVGSLVAQWLAWCAATPEVGGSNPTRGKMKKKRCRPSLQHLHRPTSLPSCNGYPA